MTTQLKDLMTEAVDAQAPYVADLDALMRTGRRQVRRRRTAGVVVMLAAIAVVVGGTAIAFDAMHRSSQPAVAPTTPMMSVGPGGSTGKCTAADGGPTHGWSFDWPVLVNVQDTFGRSTVYRSPTDSSVVSFCTFEWGNGAQFSVVPGGAKNGIVVRKSAAEGRGARSGSSVTSVFGAVLPGTPPRITVETADGYVGVATVRNGYFVYRRVEHSPWPGPTPRAIVRFKYTGKAEYVASR
jgi:hypothetical protein